MTDRPAAIEVTHRTYRGVRAGESRDEIGEVVVTVNGQPLDPRFDLVNHSPTGFEWGYEGSGPAQLSFAIVYDYLLLTVGESLHECERLTSSYYQDFKRRVVARWAGMTWEITSTEVAAILAELGYAP